MCPSFYCHRCGQTFEAQKDLEDHSRSNTWCVVRAKSSMPEGITPQLDRELSRRQKTKTQKDKVAQWYRMHESLFPEHPSRPESVYVDELEDAAAFEEFLTTDGVRIVSAVIHDPKRRSKSTEQKVAEGVRQVLSQWRTRGMPVISPAEESTLIPNPRAVNTRQSTPLQVPTASALTLTSNAPPLARPDFACRPEFNNIVAVPDPQDLVPESAAVSLARRDLNTKTMYGDFGTAVGGSANFDYYGARLDKGGGPFVPVNGTWFANLAVGGAQGAASALIMATSGHAFDSPRWTEDRFLHNGPCSSSRHS